MVAPNWTPPPQGDWEFLIGEYGKMAEMSANLALENFNLKKKAQFREEEIAALKAKVNLLEKEITGGQ